MGSGVTITRLEHERLHELGPLWAALYEHHRLTSPQLQDRQRTLDDSWRDRSALEAKWLDSEQGSFVLAAELGGELAGYAFVRVIAGPLAASWEFSDPHAELATLSVAADRRGQGIGTMLMEAVYAELRELRITDLTIAVITSNTTAARLYEHRGAVPFLTTYVQHVPSAHSAEPRRPPDCGHDA